MNEITLSIVPAVLIGLIISIFTVILIFASFYLRNYRAKKQVKKLEKWRKFSEIEKKQIREENKNYEELVESLSDSCFDYISKNYELRKSFEHAVKEIKDLRQQNKNLLKSKFELVDEIKKLTDKNSDNQKQIEYLKSVKNHKKRPVVNEPESEYWECRTDDYHSFFQKWKTYKISKSKITEPSELFLIGETGSPYLVFKKDFKPVKN